MNRIRIFSRFEIFWHWAQALLIVGLLATGFEMHGSYTWLGFESAFKTHIVLAFGLIVLWAFAIFWHLVTGEWRQYMRPQNARIVSIIMYYAYGIFTGEHRPYTTTPAAKHNPLQRLAYVIFKGLIAPALWISGLLLLFYATWQAHLPGAYLELSWIAAIHVSAAFALLVFLIGHIYMAATTATPWYGYLYAMITGYQKMTQTPSDHHDTQKDKQQR
ncbi:cytochrome b/b6 domain-containing protein [Thiorhodospira sibirica]|uniref:cytochrome b/b6 domain-containing protein n=1 Tax=Thiorhodospira sibirica TaxID=154347 RepID=UPI00022C0559|nr:cytochrome b/b6 domain-containing protein [Thiorhodospira sibirica]